MCKKIVQGRDAQIDHIISRQDGGGDTPKAELEKQGSVLKCKQSRRQRSDDTLNSKLKERD